MQAVSPEFLAAFAAGSQEVTVVIELLESSGYNYPGNITVTWTSSGDKPSSNDVFAVKNLGDGQSVESLKYLVLDQVKDNGQPVKWGDGYRLTGPGMKRNLGWWSAGKSDSAGNFAVPPWVQAAYSAAYVCNRIRVSTSQAYSGSKLVNILVWYEGAGDFTDLGNFDFGSAYRVVASLVTGHESKRVTKIKVRVLSTKRAAQFAKLLEVEPVMEWGIDTLATLEDYFDDLSLRKSSGEMEPLNPACPGVGVNELTGQLSTEAPFAPRRNQLIQVHMGFGEEILPQGLFLIADMPSDPDGYTITAYSLLGRAQAHPYPNTIFKNRKVSEIVQEALNWMGYRDADIVFSLASDPNWPWYVLQDVTCDQALAKLAEEFNLAIFEQEDGRVKVIDSYGASVLTITDDYIDDFEDASPALINHVTVYYGALSQGKLQSVLSADLELAASETKTASFRLSPAPVIGSGAPLVDSFKDAGGEDLAAEIVWWQIDSYFCNVQVRNLTATPGTARIVAQGYPVAFPQNELVVEAQDEASIQSNGLFGRDYKVYTGSAAQAQALADARLKYLQGASGTLLLTLNRPAPHLQLRDVVTVDSDLHPDLNGEYVIISMPDVMREQPQLELLPKTAVV